MTNSCECTWFSAPSYAAQVYVCAAFLACWQHQMCSLEFQDLIMFLQKLPTQEWTETDIESMLSNAYVLHNTYDNARSHLQT